MKINRTVIIIILSGIYIGLMLSGAFRKLEYLEGDVSDTGDDHKKIDAWIKRNNLDTVGNPIGTMYTGGTPLFDQNTGTTIDKYDYIINNHRDKPWNTEDDAVGDGVDFGRRAPETDFAPSPPLKPRPDNGVVVELVSEEEERPKILPFSGGSTVPTKPGQNAVLGNPPMDKEMEEILRGLPLLGTYTDKSITRAMDLKKKTQEVFDGNFTEEEKQQALREIHGIPPSGVFGDDEVCAFPKSARVSSGDTPSCNPLGVRDIDSGFIEDPNSEYGCCMPGENWHHRFYAQPIATLDSAPTLNIPDQIEILPDLSAAVAAAAPVISTDPTRRVPGYVGESVIKPTMDVGPSPETTPMPTLEEDAQRRRRLAAEEERVNGSMLPFTDGFPEHWGERPRVETADIKAFPPEFGGIGGRSGSSTMYSWISENLQMDKDNGIDYISLIRPDPEYELDGRFYTTPMPSPPDREFDELKLAAAVLAQAETATDEPSDKKNMNIGIGIGVGVLALFLILFTYYKLRRRY